MTLADIDWPMILAGLGLFLFGIEYMGDGLKGYSGDKMNLFDSVKFRNNSISNWFNSFWFDDPRTINWNNYGCQHRNSYYVRICRVKSISICSILYYPWGSFFNVFKKQKNKIYGTNHLWIWMFILWFRVNGR